MKIGFIGLGHMGAPMAGHLVKHGFDVQVYDLSKKAVNRLVKLGAKKANSLANMAREVDIIYTMLPADVHVKTVLLHEDNEQEGILAHLAPGKMIIDSSSISVKAARILAKKAAEKGIAFLDAPVSGGMSGAKAATLTFMVGGDVQVLAKAKAIFECLGKNIIHAGANGNGQAAKICNNMLLAISMIGVSEAFALGEKLGLDAQTFFAISSKSSGQCWSMTSYAPMPGLVATAPSNNKYKPGFAVDMMLKDLKLSQDAAQNVSATTPLGAQAMSLYGLFSNLGHGDMDFSAIVKLINGELAK